MMSKFHNHFKFFGGSSKKSEKNRPFAHKFKSKWKISMKKINLNL